jgi:hypothetical protein
MTIKPIIQQFEMIDPNLVKVENYDKMINFVLNNIDNNHQFTIEIANQIINLQVNTIGANASICLQDDLGLIELFTARFNEAEYKWQFDSLTTSQNIFLMFINQN